MSEFIIYLNSNAAEHGNFLEANFNFENEISLSQGQWYCSVIEVVSDVRVTEDVFLCCDFIGQSIVDGRPMRVLKALKGVSRGRNIQPIEISLPVTKDRLNQMSIYASGNFKTASFLNKSWSITLRLYKLL